MIRMSRSSEHTVSTVSSPRHQASDEIGDTNYRSDLVDPCSIGQGWLAAADDADGADANAAVHFA